MRWRLLSVLACGLFAAGPLAAGDPEPKTRYAIPYRLTDSRHIMVRAKINGKGPFNLIMDTGAPTVFLNKPVAPKIGLPADAKGWVEFDSFEIEGGLKVEKARGRVEEIFQAEGMNALGIAGVELHGMIGYDLLARYRITYDLTADKLIFEPIPGFEPTKPMSVGGKGGDDLQGMGKLMKTLAPLLGIKPNFNVAPRGFVGIELADDGVTVKGVLSGSPADKAGLKPGDKIVAVKDADVGSSKELTEALAKAGVGAKVEFTVKRGDKTMTVEVELGRGL